MTNEFYLFELVYNQVHNIMRRFDWWANFPFATSETKRD